MFRSLALALLLSPCLVTALNAADEGPAQAVAPYLDDQAFAVLHADLTRLDLEQAFKQFEKLGAPRKMTDELRRAAKDTLDTVIKAGIKQVFVVASMAHLPDQPPLLIMPIAPGETGKGGVKLLLELAGLKTREDENVLLAGGEKALKLLKGLKPTVRPEIERGFKAAGDAPLRAVMFPNNDVRRAFEELVPGFPRELGGGPSAPLTRGLRWISLGLGAPPAANVSLTIQMNDETSAKTVHDLIAAGFKLLAADKGVREAVPNIEKLIPTVTPKAEGDKLVLTVKEEQFAALILPAMQRARAVAGKQVIVNSMKQIGLAFHSYASDHTNVFPAYASFDKQNKPLLSWRVRLLPYIEQGPLYKQFKLDEPWDSEHNKKLIKKMPAIYASSLPQLAGEGRTAFVVPTGPGTLFSDKTGLQIAQIPDGSSLTILAVEADEERAVIWTKPDDLRIDPKNPMRGLRKHDGKAFHVLFMDGSVRAFSVSIAAETLAALFTPNGGEVVNLP